MSIKTCKQHANEPIFIYAQCAGCEIQRYRDEVKQLKAENERLERNRDMWKGQVERQGEELTSLRKDAERYRWLRSSDWYVGSDDFYCSEGGSMENYSNENFSPDDLDATIDAAISSPENH